jgi:endonuclease/exonuclease/phosphatase family metal-dependent hydrolase
MLVTRTTAQMTLPSLAERQAVIDGPVTPQAFRQAFAAAACLQEIEMRPPPRPAAIGKQARIAFWNAERLKYQAPSAALMARLRADVLMLCELDLGMARTGNRHTTRDLADTLGQGYVFGAEFVELGLGDLREQKVHAGENNSAGINGGGFVSGAALARPALVRLETSGRWFDGGFHERRVGGRIGMLAEITVGGLKVLLASVHYESHTGPDDRLLQTQVLLDAIDTHAPGTPALIGGDFNTASCERDEKHDRDFIARALAADPDRLAMPVPYEPMFDLLKQRGYEWENCNAPGPTQRTRPDGTPAPPLGRIDWLFARGLVCSDAATVPAVDADGVAISDHEVLAVTIAPK